MSTAIASSELLEEGRELAVTQGRVVRAEWIKFRSVRSTTIGLAAAVVVAVGLGMLFSGLADSGNGPRTVNVDPVTRALSGFNLAQLIIGVIGVMIVTSEYSTGLIRTTFATVARRGRVLRAKAVVYGGISLAAMTVAGFVAFFGGRAVYAGSAAVSALTDPGVLRAVLGTAIYTAGVGLIGIALGFLLRSTAAAIGVLFGGLLLIPGLVGLLPHSISDPIGKVLPSNAGAAFTDLHPASSSLSPLAGAAVCASWVVALLAIATVTLERRDA